MYLSGVRFGSYFFDTTAIRRRMGDEFVSMHEPCTCVTVSSMTRKRLIVGLLVFLVIFGGWFYWFYFKSTSAAIRHAETFLFRRTAVSQTDIEGEYRHFFVTNREFADGDDPLEDRATSTRIDDLTAGTFDAVLQPTLGLGMLINPTDWFQNEQIDLNDTEELAKERFIEQLRAMVDSSTHRSLLIVIHGFRERFPSALRKTAFISSVLDIDTPVLVFDWPGDQGTSLRGYRTARSVAQASGADFADALRLIVRQVAPDNLSIVANSMGGALNDLRLEDVRASSGGAAITTVGFSTFDGRTETASTNFVVQRPAESVPGWRRLLATCFAKRQEGPGKASQT